MTIPILLIFDSLSDGTPMCASAAKGGRPRVRRISGACPGLKARGGVKQSMDISPAVPAERVRQPSRLASRAAKRFYLATAVLFVALAFVGFSRFYLQGRSYPGRPIPEPIKLLVIAHGVSMSLWLLFLVMQTALISVRNVKLHMRLGMFGAGLAAAIVVLGVWLGIMSARVTPPEARIWGMAPKQFMAVPMISVLTFGVLVAIAIWKRKKPAIHRSMIISATLVTLSAAVSRIDALNHLYAGTVLDRELGPFVGTMALGLLILAARCLYIRGFDRWLAIGVGIMLAVSVFIMQIAPTAAWDRFASLFV